MTNVKASRVFVLTIFPLLLPAASAEARSCIGYPSPAAAFKGATAVFVGRVTRTTPEKRENNWAAGQTVFALVEEAFKGVRAGDEIALRQSEGGYSQKFDAGGRFLFYTSYDKKTKTWEILGCNRSTELDGAADDLLFLRALPLSAERNRVSGMLLHYEDGPDNRFSLVGRVAGAKVRIKGRDKTYEVTTDADGAYEIYDLPPGTYTIEPELNFGLSVSFPMQFGPGGEGSGVTVKLSEKTSAGADFILTSDNTISGRVLGPGGVRLPNVCVDLLAEGESEARGGRRVFDCTDAEGRYKLKEIPPGRYLIVANGDGAMSGGEPFPPAFYPGTFERERASLVTVGHGESRADYDVAVPKLLPTVTLGGVLLYSDGHAAAGEAVVFSVNSAAGRYETTSTLTDEAGRFSLTVIEGVPGKFQASLRVYEGKFEKTCPAIKRLIEESADNSGAVRVETQPVAVEADGDSRELRLVFPIPFCPPKKKENK